MKNLPLEIQAQINNFVPAHRQGEFVNAVWHILAFYPNAERRIRGAQIIFDYKTKKGEFWSSVAYVECFDEVQERQGRYN